MATAAPTLAVPRSYTDLRRGVEETLLAGQRRIEQAKVLTYFQTGRLINEHIRLHHGRADYGAHVLDRLARDLEIARTTLFQCAQFAGYFPEKPIVRHGGQLSWAHYRLLCQVDDSQQRTALLAETLKHEWTSPELQERVRAFNASLAPAISSAPASAGPALLTSRRGTPGLYPVIARSGGLALDLGFKMFLPLPPAEVARLRLSAGDIVVAAADRANGSGPLARAREASKADLFTYRAQATRVVDGDTLAVTLALPPHNEIDKKLRLRGIDCPEIDTAEGRSAKRFVESLLARATEIILTTTKPDKYDRYLADVFLVSAPAGAVYLNNALLEHGHARRNDGKPFADA
jgi:endonuclease YncB( thermonuclease family)